ncbi:hypothetical protein [Legionella lansingensis]|uniref:hypothetical protein n=1 Tax=Legionella lansingensis TaxID=45067 RepID=UPI0012FDD56E|nr:hypothetical protein [Legionella lansingensis]
MEDILKYSRDIQEACGRTGVPARVPNAKSKWDGEEKYVEECLRTLSQTPTKHHFEVYAQAVWCAAKYLENKDASTKQMEFFNQHMRFLKKGMHALLPDAHIPSPKPVYDEREPHTPAAVIFFNSGIFQKLKSYRDFLKSDRREHFFGYLAVRDKHVVLSDLIEDLERQKSMDGVQAVLEAFYCDNTKTPNSNKTKYQILNTGQDILTFILGLFGLKNTTTVNYLNKLNEYSEFTNEVQLEEDSSLINSLKRIF